MRTIGELGVLGVPIDSEGHFARFAQKTASETNMFHRLGFWYPMARDVAVIPLLMRRLYRRVSVSQRM